MANDEDATPAAPMCACHACLQRDELYDAATRAALRISQIKAPGDHGALHTAMIFDWQDHLLAQSSGLTAEDALYKALRAIGVVA